jgi:predicted phage tail protein
LDSLPMSLRTLQLHGHLGAIYGHELVLDFDTPGAAIRAIGYQNPKFFADLERGEYRLFRGMMPIDEAMLEFRMGAEKVFAIVPAVAGEGGGGGWGKVIIGVALVALAVVSAGASVAPTAGFMGGIGGPTLAAVGFGGTVGATGITWGSVALFGGLLAVSGTASLLMHSPEVGDFGARERPEERASHLLNNTVNTAEQGTPVPVAYGRTLVGGFVGSAGLNAEQIPVEEIIDAEVTATSRHGIYSVQRSVTITQADPDENIIERGFNLRVSPGLFNDDYLSGLLTTAFPSESLLVVRGALDPVIYRGGPIFFVGEIENVDTGDFFFRVVMYRVRPQDHFDYVRVLAADGTTVIVPTKASAAASNFKTGNIPAFQNGKVTPLPATIWEWDVGTSVMPVSSSTADPFVVEFEY